MSGTMRATYRELDATEKALVRQIKDRGAALLNAIPTSAMDKREYAIARTKVEEAVMWAVKGITG